MTVWRLTISGQDMVANNCIECGSMYAIPANMWDAQRQRGGYHYCGNGHQQGWGKGDTEFDKLKQERDRLIQRQAQLQDERIEAEEKAAKAERALNRHKKRSAAGTCPCCKRTFSALARHMQSQHPEFVAETGSKVVPLKILA